MPIYEYHCDKCGRDFEYFLRGQSEKVVCLACNSEKISRKVSAFAFYSKGSSGPAVSGSSCAGCVGSNCSTCVH
ncbi:MAG: zinc ribbon domain-containing protein [Candidatus Omnitrophota bacterium]